MQAFHPGTLTHKYTPSMYMHTHTAEMHDKISAVQHDPKKKSDKDVVPCYDPGTMQLLGHVPAMSSNQVCNTAEMKSMECALSF